MKHSQAAVACISILLLFLGYNKWVFSLELFGLFEEREYTEEGLKRIREFNPDRDMLYLPELEENEFFESVNNLSICRKPEVREYIYQYLTYQRDYITLSIERSHCYLPIIKEALRRNPDIPADIALLPLLESGFNPEAVSRSNAVGLWQFLKNTSSGLGLKDDSWTDERRDIEKSTEAAIRHLRYLYREFGSWELALAAYNGGSGHVKRAMKKSGAADFWSLRGSGALARETSEYVPRYAALMIIYNNRRLFGLEQVITMSPYEETALVTLVKPVNIQLLCRICNIDINIIRRYNPELKTDIAPSYDGTYKLRIPLNAAERFRRAEKSLYEAACL